jgi:hypothetical protein
MRKSCAWVFALLLFVASVYGQQPQGKLVQDLWDAAYLDGTKTGYVHTTVHEFDVQGQKIYRTVNELNLTVKRLRDTITMRMESGTDEADDGTVTGVYMKQFLGKGQELVVRGALENDGQLHVTLPDGRERALRWNNKVIGLRRQERYYQAQKSKPGDQLTYLTYEPTVTAVVTIRAAVKDAEQVDVLVAGKGQAPAFVKKTLLRVEATPDEIQLPGQKLQLPTMVSWLDDNLLPVRSQVHIDGVGDVVFYRTTKPLAMAQGAGGAARLPDIGIAQLIKLNGSIPQAHDTRSAVYRITLKNDKDVATAFAQDDRQSIKKIDAGTIELTVRANQPPVAKDGATPPGDEFRDSCYFINSDDAKVRQFAKEAVGNEADPWKKAQRIERWVHDHIQNKNFTEAFATSDQVAKTLEGDCTEHAVLAAAMCRAVGVPSRAAVGLVYFNDRQSGPVMGFHMWAEAWAKGQWLPIDATLGHGHIGAAHIKIADHSWHDIHSLTPLLPVTRVVGKVSIEVVSVNE